MKQKYIKKATVFLVAYLMLCGGASAQFIDDFNDSSIAKDPQAITGWAFFTGDGLATMDFIPGDGYASVVIDASKDKRNIWWALIKRCVSADMDLVRLSKPEYEFRIEARIRVSHAPRRVNLHLNTQRTTDFHSHLEVTEERGGKTLITISQPVLQRLIEGRTLGLAIRPLGAINASFYAMENQGGKFSARLRFNTQEVL